MCESKSFATDTLRAQHVGVPFQITEDTEKRKKICEWTAFLVVFRLLAIRLWFPLWPKRVLRASRGYLCPLWL